MKKAQLTLGVLVPDYHEDEEGLDPFRRTELLFAGELERIAKEVRKGKHRGKRLNDFINSEFSIVRGIEE